MSHSVTVLPASLPGSLLWGKNTPPAVLPPRLCAVVLCSGAARSALCWVPIKRLSFGLRAALHSSKWLLAHPAIPVGQTDNMSLLTNHKIHTSHDGDFLLLPDPISAALFIAKEHFGAFCGSPKDTPHYVFTKPIELETLRLAVELGFTFNRVALRALTSHPNLQERPVLRFEIQQRLRVLLAPAGLLPDQIIEVLQEDENLGVVVSHTIAMPRAYATSYATRLMVRSMKLPRSRIKN